MHNNLSILDAALARCDAVARKRDLDGAADEEVRIPDAGETFVIDTSNAVHDREPPPVDGGYREVLFGADSSSICSESSSSNGLDLREWGEPQPLIVAGETAPYPIDALPEGLRQAVEEVHAFVQAPISMVAASALAVLSLVSQAHVNVKRAEKLSGPVSLFMLTIADSGERKTTCDGFFMVAVDEYEAQEREKGEPLLVRHRAELESWEAKRAGVKDKIKQLAKAGKSCVFEESALRELEMNRPIAPRIPRLKYSDYSTEELKWKLATIWPSGGVVSSEAGIVFGSHGMGKDNIMRNLATLNQLWDGATMVTDRRTTESFAVRGARLTIGLQVQELTLHSFFDRSDGLARGTGFLARFLITWPTSTQGTRFFKDPHAQWPALTIFNRRMAELLALPVEPDREGALTPTEMTLSPKAKAAWIGFHDNIEHELKSGNELHDIRDVASKAADNAARLAALLQVFTHEVSSVIDVESFEAASRVVAWHLNESRRFFGELAMPKEVSNLARLDAWLISHCRRERTNIVSARAVQQFGPNGIRERSIIDSCVRDLNELHRARMVMDGRRKLIHVNPALLRGDL